MWSCLGITARAKRGPKLGSGDGTTWTDRLEKEAGGVTSNG
jgi:hypothetical protein